MCSNLKISFQTTDGFTSVLLSATEQGHRYFVAVNQGVPESSCRVLEIALACLKSISRFFGVLVLLRAEIFVSSEDLQKEGW